MNFDQIMEKAKAVVDVAAKKTGDAVEVSKLKLDCLKINGEIKELYEKLGRAVYSMNHDNYKNDDLISSVCEDIDELQEKLTDLYAEIADRQNINVCSRCGFKNPIDNTFCGKCGSKLKEDFCDYSYSQNQTKADDFADEAPDDADTSDDADAAE